MVDATVALLAAIETIDAGAGAAVDAGVRATEVADVMLDVTGEPSGLHDVEAAAPITTMANAQRV